MSDDDLPDRLPRELQIELWDAIHEWADAGRASTRAQEAVVKVEGVVRDLMDHARQEQADRLEAAEEGLRTVIGRAEGWERHYVDPGEETVARELRGIAENALRGEGGDDDGE